MGVTSAVHWWEESQMRVLVLGSLVIQFLLLTFTFLRRRAISGWARFIMWLAYLSGDAIAIYALATLFNHHKDQDRRGNNMLEVVWAPILLLHLGGNDGITAYSIEDNELWSRYLLTAVSQVTVAIYVFWRSWPPGGDKRLLQTSILLFVAGVLKCFTKAWALKRASITNLVSSPGVKRTAKKGKAGKMDPNSLEKYVKQVKAFVQEQKKKGNEAQSEGACMKNGDRSPLQRAKKCKAGEMDPNSLEKYVKQEKAFVQGQKKNGNEAQSEGTCVKNGDHSPPQQGGEAYHILSKQGEGGEMDPNSLKKYAKQEKVFVQEQKKKGNEAQSEGTCMKNGDRSPPQQGKQDKDKMDVKRASDGAKGERPPVEDTTWTQMQKRRGREGILRGAVRELLVDPSSPHAGPRLSIFKYFWRLSNQEKEETTTTRKSKEEDNKAETTYDYVRRGLATAFLLLYTNLKTTRDDDFDADRSPCTGFCRYAPESTIRMMGFIVCRQWVWISRGVLPAVACVPWTLFRRSHREADTDAHITDVIICCTALLEIYSVVALVWMYTDAPTHHNPLLRQYSLAGYLARNKNCGKVMWVASKLGCRDLVDRHWCMESCSSSSSRGITELVLGYLRDGWEGKIQDVASYHSFIDNRGHWALEGKGNEGLRWSIKEPFDESVLLWHIATDFCFFSSPFSEHKCGDGDAPPAQKTRSKCGELTACRAVQCRQMSNYMVYLLFVNPEMLLPGTRRNLFTTAYHELKDILRGNNLNPESCCCHCQQVVEKGLLKTLMKTMRDRSKKQDPEIGSQEESKQGQPKGGCNGNFIDDAWDLAQGLLKLSDDFGEEKMWEVIQGVWVEMLCFSASTCRGYLHAKALGSGGEFLSYIWLLLFYMGMETFSERLQREKEDLSSRVANNNNAAQAPRASDTHNGSGTASSSASRIHSRAAPSPSHLHIGASTSNSDQIQMAKMV